MNYGEVKNSVKRGVIRTDLSNDYGEFVNRAVRHIADSRDWTWMRQTSSIVWEAGTTRAELPGDFKALISGKGAIYYMYEGRPVQFNVVPKKRLERIHNIGWGGYYSVQNPAYYKYVFDVPVYLDWQGGIATVNLICPTESRMVANVDYYAYPEKLVNDTDVNPLLESYPELVINKAKSLCFEELNDEGAIATSDALYQKYYDRASLTDIRKRHSGVKITM